ncbi:protein phosphatase 2C domain-containing protein [Flavivirga aquimarina]|uniref:Protein phosphatase 2C domain-containing protein n=1 Tax=Flavivirga aquimarina TaxID=2027862 RepID=A0ABT8W6Y4_9FLAO|nr:protein phosphatase 2C domain-containing protein [Flavivirga aquimarina]MDO5968878.1 protein phosphatase 2C domain-containing protein [Flavivirga aquimarina]
MNQSKSTHSLVASCYGTVKKKNEDFSSDCSIAHKNIIMVADGIGTSAFSERASKEIVNKGIKYFKKEKEAVVNLKRYFSEIQRHLDILIDKDQNIITEKDYGSTLITAIETRDKIHIGYVGNGAIFHIRGNFTEFEETVYYLPWVCVNYLNPHTIPDKGKPTLFKHFGVKKMGVPTVPTVISLEKDLEHAGDIIVICTDGISSQDHLEVGEDEYENLWIEGSITLRILLNKLRNYLKKGDYSNTSLKLFLKTYKQQLEKDIVSDDFAIGIIITETALKYQKKHQDETGED